MHRSTFAVASSFAFIAISLFASDISSQEVRHSKPDQPFRVETEAFRVDVDLPSAKTASQARRIAEKTWEIGSLMYSCKTPSKPLQGNIYRDAESYRAIDQQLTKGRFQRNLAFAHHDSLSAHVALQPLVTDLGLDQTGLPTLTAQLLSHELSHLIRYHSFPNSFRNHPTWLFHGMASWIDRKVVQELGFAASAKSDPKASTSIGRVKKLFDAGMEPKVRELLSDQIDNLAFHERYDIYWLFVQSLMKNHPREMKKYFVLLKQIGGGPGFKKRAADLLLKTLNSSEETLDEELRAHVESLQCDWHEQYRSLETAGDSWFQIGFPDSNAAAWRTEPLPNSFVVSGVVSIHPGSKVQCNLRLGQPAQFTQVSLKSGFGLNVFRFQEEQWKNLTQQEMAIEVGVPIEFRMEFDRAIDTLKLTLDNEIVLLKRMELPRGIQLGLSAQNGSVIEWQNVSIAEK